MTSRSSVPKLGSTAVIISLATYETFLSESGNQILVCFEFFSVVHSSEGCASKIAEVCTVGVITCNISTQSALKAHEAYFIAPRFPAQGYQV